MSLKAVLIPAGLAATLIAGWTGLWTWGAGRAEELIDRALASEAARGRTITCGERSRGGFPFRLELTCVKPSIAAANELGPQGTARFEKLVLVSQIWEPGQVIMEANGPLVAEANGAEIVSASWKLAQASARATLAGFDTASIVFDEVTTTVGGRPTGQAKRAAFHSRATPNDPRSVDIATKLEGATLPLLIGDTPVDAEFQAVARNLLQVVGPGRSANLRTWQQAGGALEITRFRVSQGDMVGLLQGLVRLTPDGRPDGQLELKLSNPDELIRRFGLGRMLGPLGATAIAAASQPADVEGKPGRALQLRAANGALSLGFIRLPLPSIFP
ncbi:MAG: DUF2125 domain-containing protein [Alphaproteobacteria bacterium]